MKIPQKMSLLIALGLMFMFALILLQSLIHERAGNFNENSWGGLSEYRMVVRCAKYGMLFIIMTFAVFFLFEVLHNLRIHPMQYLLVGVALCLFYLLLLSFAEKLSFSISYILSSGACISLITWYLHYVLKTQQRAWLMGTLLSAGYLILFILIQSNNYTLMIGSILLFIALAAVMYLTRNVDWYALNNDD